MQCRWAYHKAVWHQCSCPVSLEVTGLWYINNFSFKLQIVISSSLISFYNVIILHLAYTLGFIFPGNFHIMQVSSKIFMRKILSKLITTSKYVLVDSSLIFTHGRSKQFELFVYLWALTFFLRHSLINLIFKITKIIIWYFHSISFLDCHLPVNEL